MSLPPAVILRSEKSELPGMARIGVKMSVTNDVITAPKAAPITTPTARSTTLPLRMKALKSLSMPTTLASDLFA